MDRCKRSSKSDFSLEWYGDTVSCFVNGTSYFSRLPRAPDFGRAEAPLDEEW